MRRHRLAATFLFVLVAAFPVGSRAHVGSPDVFLEGSAGPYKLFVTVRPPEVIPGVADVEIRAEDHDISRLRIVPLPLRGDGARFAPMPDVAKSVEGDPQSYAGHLWMMTSGAWQVRVSVEGSRGAGELTVPVPNLPTRTRAMQGALAVGLTGLLLILVLGLISITGAGAGEAQLEAGAQMTPVLRHRALRAQVVTALLIALMLTGGAFWWRSAATAYSESLYRPLRVRPTVEGNRLFLTLGNPVGERRRVNDLVPDHDHLIHLFLLRQPDLDRVWHLHPVPIAEEPGRFVQELPPLAAGSYRFYADIVHRTGVPETLVAELELPAAVAGQPLSGDDAAGAGPPVSAADFHRTVSPLPGGGQVVFLREPGPLRARSPRKWSFRIEDTPGHATADLELYMGMLGHAAFVKRDGSVFAHLHPTGSVPMAMLALAEGPGESSTTAPEPHHHHPSAAVLPSELSFPYGVPQPGDYRIFVQFKRRGVIETGIFDIHVD